MPLNLYATVGFDNATVWLYDEDWDRTLATAQRIAEIKAAPITDRVDDPDDVSIDLVLTLPDNTIVIISEADYQALTAK